MDSQDTALRIRLPPMVTTRGRTADAQNVDVSGSEYNASDNMDHDADADAEGEVEDEEEEPEVVVSKRGRAHKKVTYVESSDIDDEVIPNGGRSLRNRQVVKDEDDPPPSRYPRRSRSQKLGGFVVSDEEEDLHNEYDDGSSRRLRRNRPTRSQSKPQPSNKNMRSTRRSGRTKRKENDDDFHDPGSSGSSGSFDNIQITSDLDDLAIEPPPEPEPEDDNDGKPYALRTRQPINYAIPPPLEEMVRPPKQTGGRNGNKRKSRGLGWSASGAQLDKWMGGQGNRFDDSDSDNPTRTPRKNFGVNPFGGAIPAGGMLPGDLAAAGTPSNLGKIGDSALADADPLGVNTNVTFDEVGGLDEHIHSLKEMTLLPLLYPEVFQRFNVTPPRGVLFHGPPGTGKTLLARALAASSRSGGRQISFFMRKGADCLSKWVGEAERQLRLLFEEAKNSQPSIIFFDEIDGLAPVRSSKQDQIHASIVSTLLALMDGMDGRGQVIVIGATNRPDAVDPALRRPGRFDREFYFGLPGVEAREKILGIMTKKWEGWDASAEGEKGEKVREKLKGLAKLTKGYGGADLRALCTEAALNAIQRRYPQVYKSTDRLLLKPETIDVGLRDFMMSIKKIVPSSARSSTSAATALPQQFEPLLGEALEKVKATVKRVMPVEKPLTALEEAEFEDVGGEDGALEREMLSQSMQTLRVYRPRVIVHGSVGMGQAYIGAATLHHLEGYHVQSLELGTLLGDSTRSIEAAIVQLFVEAKRHQPSVIYIPSLLGWCAAVPETSRSTVRAMLETLLPTDPILLLAVVDGPFSALPKDVKMWFGPSKDNRVHLVAPTAEQRAMFFEPLLKDVARKPNEFADGVKRRKRVLEQLPIAPPLEPRKPSAAELALQEEADQRTLAVLKFRLGPILNEMKRKFKRFTKRATEEYGFEADENGVGYSPFDVVSAASAGVPPAVNGAAPQGDGSETQPVDVEQEGPQQAVDQAMIQRPPLFDMDLDRMHTELYRGHYLTPQDFMDDVRKIVHNAEVRSHEDLDRLHKAQAMYTAAEVSLLEFDATFKMECERMKARERMRREERMKEREKERGKDKDKEKEQEDLANGNRRATRSAGPVADLVTMTDPVKLERRLKRQRDAAENGGQSRDTSASAEEGGSHVNGEGTEERDHKRSKMVVDGSDDELRIRTPPSQLRHAQHSVRFANSMPQIVEPGMGMGNLGEGSGAGENGFLGSPSPMAQYAANHHYGQQHPQVHHQHPPGHPFLPQPQPQPHQQFNPHFNPQTTDTFHLSQPPPQPQFPPVDHMNIDGQGHVQPQMQRSGFDPTLLNPASPTGEMQSVMGGVGVNGFGHSNSFGHAQSGLYGSQPGDFQHQHQHQQPQRQPQWPPQQSTSSPAPPVASHDPNDPFAIPNSTQTEDSQLHVPQPAPRHRSTSPLRLQSILRASTPTDTERRGTPTPKEDTPVSAAMVVERSPSPPLPDFHLDESLLEGLRTKLREKTGSLTVEQLEQLRATCLGEVWRQRKEWNRDGLVRDLEKMVDEFLEEVKELEEWDEEE